MDNHSAYRHPQRQPDLLLRPALLHLEGPQGYLLRLAEANCMTVNDLKKASAGFDVAWLTANGLLAGIPDGSDLYRYVDIVAQARKKRIWNDRFTRFCPLCLSEAVFWQVGWELLFHDTCPVHGVWLVDRCSRCGDWIKPNRHRLVKCQCEADLRNEEAKLAPENARRLSAALLNRLVPDGNECLPDAFRDLDVEGLQRLIRFLGAHLDPPAGRRPLKIHSAGKMLVSWPVSSQAAEILFRWPAAFHQVLDQIQETELENRKSFVGLFRQTYQYLYQNLGDPAFQPVRTAFQDWVGESWRGQVAKRNLRLPPDVVSNPAFIPGGVAATEFGISKRRLRHLVRMGQIEGEETVGRSGRRFLMVRRREGEKVSKRLATTMNRREVMEALSLSKKRTYNLIPLLFPTASHINDAPHMPWCVPRTEVEALVAVGENLPEIDSLGMQQVTLAHLLQYWSWDVRDVAALVKAVQAGTLIPSAALRSIGGISRWVFNAEEARSWRSARNQHESNWLTIEIAAKVLGTHPEVVSWLVSSGFLKAERVLDMRRPGYRIRRTEVDRFRGSYVFAVKIAGPLRMRSRELKTLLESHGIFPLEVVGSKTCRQLIYDRTDKLDDVICRTLQLRRNAGILEADLES